MSTILSKLGVTADTDLFSAFANEPELLENNSKTTLLKLNQAVPYRGSINGTAVNAFVTLREASLTRLSMLRQEQPSTKSWYWLATGIMNPVKIDIDVVIEGERIAFTDVLRQIAIDSSGKDMSSDEFLTNCSLIGLKYADGMPLFVQQFGASEDKFRELIEVFKAHGAEDQVPNMNLPAESRIKAAYALAGGMPVTEFEIGSMDRSRSARFAHDGVGQGFVDLIDAQFSQFTRVLGLRKSARVKRTEAMKPEVNETMAVDLNKSADLDLRLAKMAVSNWAGAQRRLVRSGASFAQQDIYDPVNAPCGRFTVVQNDGSPYKADLWTNKNATSVPVVDTSRPIELF